MRCASDFIFSLTLFSRNSLGCILRLWDFFDPQSFKTKCLVASSKMEKVGLWKLAVMIESRGWEVWCHAGVSLPPLRISGVH